jgi:hypothetical protein
MKTPRWLPAIALLLVAAVALPAFADKPHGPKPGHSKSDPASKIQRILIKEVGLSEVKAKDVETVLMRFTPDRRKHQKEIFAQRNALRDLLQKKSDDQNAYGKALKGLRDARKALVAVRDEQFDAIAKLITPKEHTKLLRAMPELQRRLNELDRDRSGDEDEKGKDFEF